MLRKPDTIKCSKCGRDSGISLGPLLMVIPPGGLKCPCGAILIAGNRTELTWQQPVTIDNNMLVTKDSWGL